MTVRQGRGALQRTRPRAAQATWLRILARTTSWRNSD